MCEPGIKARRTDGQLANELRRHIRAIQSIKDCLNDRGYNVALRGDSGYLTSLPVAVQITKEVAL